MARDDQGSGNTLIYFSVGLLAGVALGGALGLLLAPKDGAALRKDIGEKARKLKEEAGHQYEEAGRVARGLTEQGKDLAERFRYAASEGIRETRKHLETPRNPSDAELAGVDGLSDHL